MPVSNPQEKNSRAVFEAFWRGHWEIFDILCPVSDLLQARTHVPSRRIHEWDNTIARRQQVVLSQAVAAQTAEQHMGRARKI